MIRIIEAKDYPEIYKMDVRLAFDDEEIKELPLQTIYDEIAARLLDIIKKNKDTICDGNEFSDFKIDIANTDLQNGVITYEIKMEDKITGKYLVTEVSYLFKDIEVMVRYHNDNYPVRIRSIEPILRYIGSED